MDPKLAHALEGLRDIHLPEPVGVFPLAPAWWVLAAGVLLASVATALVIRARRRRRQSLRTLALAELAALEQRDAADREALAIELTLLLRRVAIGHARQPNTELAPAPANVASLHGEPWVAYLTEGRSHPACSARVARELIRSAYAGAHAASEGDPREWIDFTRAYIQEIAA